MPAPVLQFKRGNAGVAGTVPALRPGEPAISLNNFDFFIGIDTSVANNKFFGSHRYWGREDGTNSLRLKLVDKNGTNYVAIKAPNTVGSNVTYTLPGTQGSPSSVLTNDGTGTLSWSSGSANPVFSGIATFTDTTDNILGNPNTGSVQIDGGVGINSNLTVGAGLSVNGESYFIGTSTFSTITASVGDFSTLTGSLTGTISTATRAITVDTVTAGDSSGQYYITFVNSHNSPASAETVYTDDGIYYDPGANKFTTQHALFTGNVEVQGSFTGTATTATRATLVDTTGTSDNNTYYVTFVDTSGGQTSETLRVGTALSLNASSGNVRASGDLIAGSGYLASGNGTRAMYMYNSSGDVSFQGKVISNSYRSSTNINNTLTFNDLDAIFARNILITGITTIGTGVGITQFASSISIGNSTSSAPNSSAVIDYVTSQIGNIDLTLGINADTGGPSTVNTSQTLNIYGTANEVDTSVSGQTITIGLPDAVVVGTSLSTPTVRTNIIQSSNTGSTVLTLSGNDATFADDLTVNGNLYVNGSTTQVNTSSLTVEDRTIELGIVDGAAPTTTTTWDLGVLFNYYTDGSAKKSALVWEQDDARFKLGSSITDSAGSGNNNPQIGITTYAGLEISDLWINNACTGGSQQVIGCIGGELQIQNVVVDAGSF